jgi:hypothetical protein
MRLTTGRLASNWRFRMLVICGLDLPILLAIASCVRPRPARRSMASGCLLRSKRDLIRDNELESLRAR